MSPASARLLSAVHAQMKSRPPTTRDANGVEPLDEAVDHVRGPSSGHLILEYGDYECPNARAAYRQIHRVQRQVGEGVRFAFRHFPLTAVHPHVLAASAAAEAAALQDRFWPIGTGRKRLATGGCEMRRAAHILPGMSTTTTSERFTALPDDQTLAATVIALEEHGFSVEVVDDLDAAREAVLALIPEGASVMTNTSVTLQETGIANAIDDGGPYDSARNKLSQLDYATQLPEMKAIGGQPDYALGSVHAVTRDGTLVIASASGSQLASYAWGAANVIFVVGAQKLVPDLEAAHERIVEHSLKLEDARAYAAYGQNSLVGKVLEIHQEPPGRIHVVLIRQAIGF
jgi:YkgG family uncharacterized protein